MSKKRMLIVDDEENILIVLKRFLAADGVEVMTACRIEDAEQAIKQNRLDVVIADIRLTGVLGREGLELLSYVKDKSPDTRVIIMTGYGSPEIEKEALKRGASFYFDKPVDLTVMKERLRELGLYS